MFPTSSALLLVGFYWWNQLRIFFYLVALALLWWKAIREFQAEQEGAEVKKGAVGAMFRSPAAPVTLMVAGVLLVDYVRLLSPVLVVFGAVWLLVQLTQKRKAEGKAGVP